MATTKKKVFIDENDVYKITERYRPTVIISLLQEVFQYSGKKIDWNALVQKSTTGISNAREYQMLWRHLAYRDPLLEKLELEAGTQPLDDDSDLECQLEAVPSVSAEASSEAAASVKRLLQPSDGLVGNPSAASAQPPKKKRKVWTEQEDEDLISAVQKYGERNWANILKGEFKHDRTASQLSQRWSTIKKRRGISIVGGGNPAASSTQSEQVLVATRKAVAMALNMPNLGSFTTTNSGIGQPSPLSTPASTSSAAPAPHQVSNRATNQKKASVSSSKKSRTTAKNLSSSVKPSVSPIQAAAFAAGGRIATPVAAASLFKAAQSNGAFHIMPCSSALPKPTSTAGMPLPYAGAELGSCHVPESSGRCTSYITSISCTMTSKESMVSKNDIPNTKVDHLTEFDEMVARERLSSKHCGITDIGMTRTGVSLQKDPVGAKTQSGVDANVALDK